MDRIIKIRLARLLLIVFAVSVFANLGGFAQVNTVRAASFSDVPEGTVHYGALEYLKNKGVISGYQDGTFKAEKTINRAEALKMVTLATTQNLDSQISLNFPDVHESDWFFKFVRKAFENKIVEGYQDGKFKPENNINLAESLKMILLSFKVTLGESVLESPYPDVDKGVWYANYAGYSKVKQLIWALDDGKLHADRDITRGDYAEIIYRLMYIKEQNLATFPLSTDWPTYTSPSDHFLLKYPFDWLKIDAGHQIIFWKQDKENKQLSFARVYPNSATAVVAVDINEDKLILDDYLAGIQYDASAVRQQSTLNGYPFESVSIASTGSNDYYFELPNKYILVIYTQLGSGLNKDKLAQEIRYLVGSVRYSESSTANLNNKETLLSEVRKNILVKGEGETGLKLIKDLVVIDTDTIGIGTGPVDYYFSKEFEVTLKYERNSKTLLALADSRTTAF